MSNAWNIIAQAALSATTLTDLYTVPAAKTTLVKFVVTNRGNTSTTFRIAVAKGGAAASNAQYLVYDGKLYPNDVYESMVAPGVAGDVYRAYAGNGNVTVQLTGMVRDA